MLKRHRTWRKISLISMLSVVLLGAWALMADEAAWTSGENHRILTLDGPEGLLSAPGVSFLCFAGSDDPQCARARRLAEKPPCMRPEDCEALDVWRQLAGEPRFQLTLGSPAYLRLAGPFTLVQSAAEPSESQPEPVPEEGTTKPRR